MPGGLCRRDGIKEALLAAAPCPALVVRGRLGGSAITVAAINALASEVE
jgi:precorrin-8X/cobalt-precorrin-8 methylmutase